MRSSNSHSPSPHHSTCALHAVSWSLIARALTMRAPSQAHAPVMLLESASRSDSMHAYACSCDTRMCGPITELG